MSNLHHETTSALEEHKAFSESISQRLNSIYNDLCEYEVALNKAGQEEPLKLMELLETISELYSSTEVIRSHGALIQQKQGDLQQQMQLLQQSVQLLKLENKSEFNESM